MSAAWGAPALKEELRAIERESGGTLCLAARCMRTGDAVRYQGDRRCKTASVIKLPILVHAAMAAAEGKLSWSDLLILTEVKS